MLRISPTCRLLHNCRSLADDCAENPCLLGANCTDLVNDFVCDCPPGFTGKRCHQKVDLCGVDPCVHGVCVDRLFYSECLCQPGWEGQTCERNVDDCLSSPCANNGVCIDAVDGFRCQCDTGYTGSRCQHTIDDCESSPCQNGGSCFDQVWALRGRPIGVLAFVVFLNGARAIT